jgi:glutathione S-transferase
MAGPAAGLLPHDAEVEARAIEIPAYVEGIIHGQSYGRLFAPSQFAPRDGLADTVRQRGREIVEQGFGLLDKTLAKHDIAAGERFTIADAALFYVERWAARVDISLPRTSSATSNGFSPDPSSSKCGSHGEKHEPSRFVAGHRSPATIRLPSCQ